MTRLFFVGLLLTLVTTPTSEVPPWEKYFKSKGERRYCINSVLYIEEHAGTEYASVHIAYTRDALKRKHWVRCRFTNKA